MTNIELQCDLEEFQRALSAASEAVKDFTERLEAKVATEDDPQ